MLWVEALLCRFVIIRRYGRCPEAMLALGFIYWEKGQKHQRTDPFAALPCNLHKLVVNQFIKCGRQVGIRSPASLLENTLSRGQITIVATVVVGTKINQ